MISSRLMSVVTLIVTLAFGFTAGASECSKAYEKLNDKYFKTVREIRSQKFNKKVFESATVLGTGLTMICMMKAESRIGCGMLAFMTGAAGLKTMISQSAIAYMENGRGMFQIYDIAREGGDEKSVDYANFLIDVGANMVEESDVPDLVVSVLEDGSMCNAKGEPTADYETFVAKVKEKLEAI